MNEPWVLSYYGPTITVAFPMCLFNQDAPPIFHYKGNVYKMGGLVAIPNGLSDVCSCREYEQIPRPMNNGGGNEIENDWDTFWAGIRHKFFPPLR